MEALLARALPSATIQPGDSGRQIPVRIRDIPSWPRNSNDSKAPAHGRSPREFSKSHNRACAIFESSLGGRRNYRQPG